MYYQCEKQRIYGASQVEPIVQPCDVPLHLLHPSGSPVFPEQVLVCVCICIGNCMSLYNKFFKCVRENPPVSWVKSMSKVVQIPTNYLHKIEISLVMMGIAYLVLHIWYCIFVIAYLVLHFCYCILGIAYLILHFGFCIFVIAYWYCIFVLAYWVLHIGYCILGIA